MVLLLPMIIFLSIEEIIILRTFSICLLYFINKCIKYIFTEDSRKQDVEGAEGTSLAPQGICLNLSSIKNFITCIFT
jgi:hypothetical protein